MKQEVERTVPVGTSPMDAAPTDAAPMDAAPTGAVAPAPGASEPDDLLDAIAGVDRAMASLSAIRARMIAQSRDWAALSEAVDRAPDAGSHAARTRLARDILVSELAALLRIPAGSAARLVAESETLVRRLPSTLEALGRGDITYRHATVLVDNAESLLDLPCDPEADVKAHEETLAEVLADFERAVLPAALRLNTSRFKEHARRARERAHPVSMGVRRAAQAERRTVGIEAGRDGMAWLTAYLPAEQAIAIDDRLDQLAAAIRDPADTRTFAQLRADAFCELMISGEPAARSSLPRGIHARVLVAVPVLTLLGLDDEPGTLEGYGPIPAEVAKLLAAGAPGFTRILTHPETGVVLSVGRDRYQVPAELRLWLRIRDETCRAVGCGRRAATSDVDHGHPWADGGHTAGDNLAHLCRGDHTRKTRLGWKMQHLPGGHIRWTSPMGRTYLTQPANIMRT